MRLGPVVESKLADKQGCLLPNLAVLVAHQCGGDGNNVVVDHLVGGFLVVDELVQRLEGISALGSLETFLEENLLELFNGPVEDSTSDLVRHDFG